MTELRALSSLEDGARAVMLGYYDVSDGGEGGFVYDIGSAAADNGGTVIAPDGGTGRWLRVYASRRLDPKWFGAIADGNSHPLSNYFATLGDAQAVYPHATSLDDEIDGVAIQAAINVIKGSPGDSAVRGGCIAPSGGNYLYNVRLDIDRSLGMTFRGLAQGAVSGAPSAGGTIFTWTGEGQYQNPSYTAPAITARSSYGVEFYDINFQYTKPTAQWWGHLIEFGHYGGNTIGIHDPLPAITFSGTTITRASGSFITDGWKVGDIVHIQGSGSNDGNTGIITTLTALVITTAATTWATETISFTGTGGPYSSYPDTQFATFTNCHFVENGPISAGTGAKALVALTGAIFCTFNNCFFGTAEDAILFRDFGRGSGVYSNSHVFNACRFGYHKRSAVSGGQSIDFVACGWEGLGGELTAAYYDDHARTVAQVDCTFTFDNVAKSIVRSSGDWSTDGWSGGLGIKAGDIAGNYVDLGNVVAVSGTYISFDTAPAALGVAPFKVAGVPQALYGFQVYNDTAASGDGIQSTSQLGNTLTISGTTMTRSDGGSFIDDGWVIGEPIISPGGGGVGSPVVRVTDSTLYLTSAPGDTTHTSDWYIRGGGGGGPINFHGGWMGDQYRFDSWIKTLGCTGLTMRGVFIDSNARIVWNRDGELTGSISGCTTSGLIRPYEGVLCEGTNGITGFDIGGPQGFSIRNRSSVSIANLSMHGSRSIVTGEAHQLVDDTFIKQVLRLVQGLMLTTDIYNPFGTDTPAALLELVGGDLRISTIGKGPVLLSPNGTAYRITMSNAGTLGTEPE